MSTIGFGPESSNGGDGRRPPGGGGFAVGNGSDGRPWPALALRVEPAAIVPGVPAQIPLAVRNDSGMPADVRFDLAGLNPEWVVMPEAAGPLAPGDIRNTSLTVSLPAGYPPSELRAALHARALGPGTVVPLGRPASADVVLRVAETGLVEATMPDEVYGSFHGRFHVAVRNRGREPQVVELSGSSPVGRVKWSTRRLRLEPGAQTRDPGRGRVQTGFYRPGPPGPVCGKGERPGRAGDPGRDVRAKAMALVVAPEGGGDPDHRGVVRRPRDLYRREAHQRLFAQSHGGPHGEAGGT